MNERDRAIGVARNIRTERRKRPRSKNLKTVAGNRQEFNNFPR